jgi:YD repeat-containing protein
MSTRITAYRTPLVDPRGFSLRGAGKHPREAGGKEHLCLERELDDAGHETLVVRHGPGGEVLYRKASRWEGGRRAGEEEVFAETGATVTHEIERDGDAETERVLFDGELDSTIERTYHRPGGTLASERTLDSSGELADLFELDEAGRLMRQADAHSEQRFFYDPSGEIAEAVITVDGEVTVETTSFEAGLPVATVIVRNGKEVGRRTITREGRRRVEEELRDGRLVLRRVEESDPKGRPLSLEESSARTDGAVVETRRMQEWSTDGMLLRSTAESWLTVPGAGRRQTGSGRHELVYDDAGRISERLLDGSQQEELEGDSYYRYEYRRGG